MTITELASKQVTHEESAADFLADFGDRVFLGDLQGVTGILVAYWGADGILYYEYNDTLTFGEALQAATTIQVGETFGDTFGGGE